MTSENNVANWQNSFQKLSAAEVSVGEGDDIFSLIMKLRLRLIFHKKNNCHTWMDLGVIE